MIGALMGAGIGAGIFAWLALGVWLSHYADDQWGINPAMVICCYALVTVGAWFGLMLSFFTKVATP